MYNYLLPVWLVFARISLVGFGARFWGVGGEKVYFKIQILRVESGDLYERM